MQKVERANQPPPQGLLRPEVEKSREAMRDFMLMDAEKRAQTRAPVGSGVLDDKSVNEALRTLFGGRCAFCEAQADTRPYRFRPPAEALPFQRSDHGHLYYVWLADAWENLYPICACCQPSQPEYFPIVGARAPLPDQRAINRYVDEKVGLWRAYPIPERSLLLDPCQSTDFHRSLRPRWDGRIFGISDRGAATVETFNLNHEVRVRQREKRHAAYFENLVTEMAGNGARQAGASPEVRRTIADLFRFAELEFGGTWYLLLRRLAAVVGSSLGPKPVLSPSRILRFYMSVYGQPDIGQRLCDARKRLEDEDAESDSPAQASAAASIASRRRTMGDARLAEVRLTNFKAIEDLPLRLPKPRPGAPGAGEDAPVPSVLILGENAAGKSSILEGIALALSSESAREDLKLSAQSFVLDPSLMGGSNAPTPRAAKVEVTLDDGTRSRLTITSDTMGGNSDPDFRAPPVFAYGAFRHYQHSGRRYSPGQPVHNLFDSRPLSNPQPWLLTLDETRFAMVIRALREILSIEGEFEVIQRDPEKRRCWIVTAVQGRNGESTLSRTPLSAVSSGFRSVLAMACEIMQGLMDRRVLDRFETLVNARGVVLIDEVEAHLHPRWKMQIMRGLRRALPNMTIIATTHDPLCLRGMEDGEVVVLQRVASEGSGAETNLPVFVEQLVDLPNLAQLRIDQLLTSDLFQLHSTDAAEIDDRLASVGELLAKRRAGAPLSEAERATLDSFQRDIAEALPVGSSQAHRLVQEAVADFLRERRAASQKKMEELNRTTKDSILQVLRGI
ncbi:AAA family ATPase [Azospirillum melinis]|nr:AAA family ATPase [Azospirillum melinis]MBP2310695.1 energy-coupling factor transporter ATP-binding protein EcfA2 [Azospirillum melinis]